MSIRTADNMDDTRKDTLATSTDSAIESNKAILKQMDSARWWRGLPHLLPLVGLGFFTATLAFFPARSSELLMSLAYGRGLHDGTITIGTEPFSVLLGEHWANPHWFFDWLSYLIFQLDGGQGQALVAAKTGILAFAIIFSMACLCFSKSWFLPSACLVGALGMLACSPYFDASSSLVTVPMVLILLALLHLNSIMRSPWISQTCLLLLMCLWANLDSSFVFGLVIWLLALILPTTNIRNNRDLIVWIGGILICLIHPFPTAGFRELPELMAPLGQVSLRMDPLVTKRFLESGFSASRFSSTQAALNPAGLSFPVMAVLAAISFVLIPRAFYSWRFPAILFSLALVALRHKAIPVFACVATFVACLNLIDFLEFQEKRKKHMRNTGVLVFLICFVASLLALPGFLGATGTSSRLPGWGLSLRDSHAALAGQLARDHQRLPGNTLIASLAFPDFAAYVAWLAPGVRTFVDPRLHLFSNKYNQFASLVEDLGKSPSGAGVPKWRETLAGFNIVRVAASPRSMEASQRVLQQLLRDGEWENLSVSGSWIVATVSNPMASPERKLALGNQAMASLMRIDSVGDSKQSCPSRVITYSGWEFWQPRNDLSRHTDSADIDLALAETPNPLRRLGFAAKALSESRRGLHLVPDSIKANESVFRSLLTFGDISGINGRSGLLSDLAEVELIGSCARIIKLKPGESEALNAHGIMAELFNRKRFLDLELLNRKEFLRIGKKLFARISVIDSSPDNPNFETAAKDLERAAGQLDGLQAQLSKRQEMFTNELTRIQKAAGREVKGLEKAVLALQLGLAMEAEKELVSQTTISQVLENEREKSSFFLLAIQLALQTGRLDDAASFLSDEEAPVNLGAEFNSIPHPGTLLPDLLDARNIHPDRRLPALTWLQIQLSVAMGDYAKAAGLIGRTALEQINFFSPRLNRRMAEQLSGSSWLPWVTRDQRVMEAIANSASIAIKADSFPAIEWLVPLMDTLAMIRQEDSERIRIPSTLIAELLACEGRFLYLSGQPEKAKQSFRKSLELSVHANQFAAVASRLAAPNYWAEHVLQEAVAEHGQRISGFTPPSTEPTRRMLLLLELTMVP